MGGALRSLDARLAGRLIARLGALALAAAVAACTWGRGPTPLEEGFAGRTVTVAPGDTVYAIADRNGVSLRELIRLNGLGPPYLLSGGEVLRLPDTQIHVVQAGETLDTVAGRYGVPSADLALVNGVPAGGELFAGQSLRIPAMPVARDVAQAPYVPPAPIRRPGDVEVEVLAPIGAPAATAGPAPATPANAAVQSVPGTPPGGTLPTIDAAAMGLEPQTQVATSPRTVIVERRPADDTAVALGPAPGADLPVTDAPVADAPVPDTRIADVDVSVAAAPPATVAPVPRDRPAVTAPQGDGRFRWPVVGPVIRQFGATHGDGDGDHDGMNIRAERGTPVTAAADGVVAYAGNELRGYGNLILIRHADGWVTAYAHTDSMLVARDEPVTAGQTIATVGSTGSVAEPQLHFELRQGSQSVDPQDYLPPMPDQIGQSR